ncbi:uncharacterized protein BBA_07773 [Beauveria bassiana ARSEF 2860]|uniref:Uncharacterized protein n=1 Tax=Beauveria bassiana (strain ARSEF 2860) TaxID=655819 RepID=J4KM58_BEAB2|nr:uncharacterized protein BBA_07773 [Beauveria bassiana ARSEF 2860]EJP63379.1 hypothetical protein BBA_07773 [Beauveria bassiana ARSEF 2860]
MTSEIVYMIQILLPAFRIAAPDRFITSLGCLSVSQVLIVKVVVEYGRTIDGGSLPLRSGPGLKRLTYSNIISIRVIEGILEIKTKSSILLSKELLISPFSNRIVSIKNKLLSRLDTLRDKIKNSSLN